MQRRNYGTGSLFTARGKWYGQWWVEGRQIKRAIGPKRQPGSRDGLTRKQAEAELRRLMQTTRPAPRTDGVTFEDAASGVPALRRATFGRSTRRRSPTIAEWWRATCSRSSAPSRWRRSPPT